MPVQVFHPGAYIETIPGGVRTITEAEFKYAEPPPKEPVAKTQEAHV